jgi:hypothetical protein
MTDILVQHLALIESGTGRVPAAMVTDRMRCCCAAGGADWARRSADDR